MSLTQPHGDLLDSKIMGDMVRAMKDVATFKKLREGIRDRKPKFGFITN
jgi:hypothetical protein